MQALSALAVSGNANNPAVWSALDEALTDDDASMRRQPVQALASCGARGAGVAHVGPSLQRFQAHTPPQQATGH
ncbi:MAG: hypothetical protein ACREYF_23625 [Gammaproteobacteria bacterium]